MRLLYVANLKPGMKTARPVFEGTRMLLDAAIILTDSTIKRLPLWGIFYVYVVDERLVATAA